MVYIYDSCMALFISFDWCFYQVFWNLISDLLWWSILIAISHASKVCIFSRKRRRLVQKPWNSAGPMYSLSIEYACYLVNHTNAFYLQDIQSIDDIVNWKKEPNLDKKLQENFLENTGISSNDCLSIWKQLFKYETETC